MSSPSAPASSAGSLAIDIRQLPWIRPLASDYAFDFARLAEFYAGDPQREDDWRDAIARVRSGPPRDPARLADVLHRQLTARQAPAEAMEAAAAFASPTTVAIVTGQQAGLFGGPLYTLHKAITAIKLAAEVSRRHGVRAVPVFWIDAEDHDWDEVRGCTVLDGDHRAHRIELDTLDGAGDRSVGRLVLEDQGRPAVDALMAALPPTEFSADLAAMLADAYAPGRSMAHAFGRVLEHWLGRYGLVVFDASDPAAKPMVSALFAKAIEAPGHTSKLAGEAGDALEARGYHAQVAAAEHAAPLFAINGMRESVRWRDGVAIVGEQELPLAELAARAKTAPEGFSPNVLLRPVAQDSMFPTICYVGGPAELAYFGQLKGIYEHFGVPMPLFTPRASATVVDSATLRLLGKYDIPFAAFQRQDELTLNQLLERQLPAEVETSFAEAAAAITSRLEALTTAAAVVDSTLEGAARNTLGKMQHDLQTLHGKVIHAAKRKDETLRRQFNRTQTQLFPNGHPQERELGGVWLMNKYGPATVDRLIDLLPVDHGYHWVLAI
ncbi:MAG: bacillithiol biosynthesis cysteine-adding enzyme BshC [Vicinamibacterales bacterium]